ncbi:MAG: hypothetical protein PCFJNLEI_03555 [Verrucomicrobiae bacterium]|nr:hypothetical protein [Verrucomicrobiae bacterium]
MKRQQKPTEAQAEIIQRAGLVPSTVTVTTKRAALPLAITYHGDGEPLHYWIVREGGALRFSDTKPTTRKPGTTEQTGEQEPEAIEFSGARYNPDKLEADLRQCGFRAAEARAIVLQVCDGDTVREAAAKIGKSHGWVGSKRIQRKVKALRAGEPLTATRAGSNTATPEPYTPSSLLDEARLQLCMTKRTEKPLRWPWDIHKVTGQPLAEHIATSLRHHPDSLLMVEGRYYVAALVDLLEAAKAGQCAHRVRGVVPEGTPAEKAAAARRALSILTSPKSGQSYELPTGNLDLVLHQYFKRVVELQREWKASNEPIPARLENIREAHRKELEGITDKQLRELMAHDPFNGAARLAEIATGYSRELFEKRCKQICTRKGFKSFLKTLNEGTYDHLMPGYGANWRDPKPGKVRTFPY